MCRPSLWQMVGGGGQSYNHRSDGRSVTGGFQYMKMKKKCDKLWEFELKNKTPRVWLMFISALCAGWSRSLFKETACLSPGALFFPSHPSFMMIDCHFSFIQDAGEWNVCRDAYFQAEMMKTGKIMWQLDWQIYFLTGIFLLFFFSRQIRIIISKFHMSSVWFDSATNKIKL